MQTATGAKPVEHILVIKLGALGDMVQALGPLAAIRQHHANAHITILSTAPYEALLRASGYVDDVWLDTRPRWYQPGAWLALRRRLCGGGFSRVYDLQTSDRSSGYFRLFWPGPWPQWSGIARGCSHPHDNPQRDFIHTIERQAEQLKRAGIVQTPSPDLSWAKRDTERFGLNVPFALLVAGGAPHRPAKRWSAHHYASLARTLAACGITPVLLGAGGEAGLLDAVRSDCPEAINLCNKTDILDIASLAGKATLAVGNDTGPMHMIAVTGCPSVVLYSHESNPALCAQRGPHVEILRRERLDDLSPDDVMAALDGFNPAITVLNVTPPA